MENNKTIQGQFQIFGSKTSEDLDCFVFVDELGTIAENKGTCKYYDDLIRVLTSTEKRVNTNIGVLGTNNMLSEVFKGTIDEVNNSMYYTYHLHDQKHPQNILYPTRRDKHLKALRAVRTILSFFSRTVDRKKIKYALKNGLQEKLDILEKIDLSRIELNKPNTKMVDCLKTVAFQVGQSGALLDGIELYTKEDIIDEYPSLKYSLMRQGTLDRWMLGDELKAFCRRVRSDVVLSKFRKEMGDRANEKHFEEWSKNNLTSGL